MKESVTLTSLGRQLSDGVESVAHTHTHITTVLTFFHSSFFAILLFIWGVAVDHFFFFLLPDLFKSLVQCCIVAQWAKQGLSLRKPIYGSK